MKLGKAILVSSGSSALAFIFNFVATTLLARKLGPAEFGSYSLLVTAATLISTLTDFLGLRYLHLVVLPRNPKSVPTALRIAIQQALLGTVPILVFGVLLPETMDTAWEMIVGATKVDSLTVALLLVAIVAVSLNNHGTHIRLAIGGVFHYNLANVINAVWVAGIIAVFVAFELPLNAILAIIVWIAGRGLGAAVTLWGLRPGQASAHHDSGKPYGREWKTGVRAFLLNVLTLASTRASFAMVAVVLGRTQLGYFALGQSLSEMLNRIPSLAGQVASPVLRKEDDTAATARIGSMCRVTVVMFLAVAVMGALFGKRMLVSLYGDEFAPAIGSLIAIAPGALCLSLIVGINSFMASRRYPPVVMVAVLVATAVNVGGCLVLAPRWGAIGAGAATSLAYAAWLAVLLFHLTTAYGSKPADLLVPRRADIKRLADTMVSLFGSRMRPEK